MDSSFSTAERFSLGGPSLPLDPRIHAHRDGVADIALAGRIIAPHYAKPLVRGCGPHGTMVREAPDPGRPAVSELLPGEEFAVLEYTGGWAWGYCRQDRRVGYVEAVELVEPSEPTHIVCEKSAPVAADERVASPVLAVLPMGSRLHGEEDGACLATEYGCVPLSHLRRHGENEEDPAAVAERLMGAPWLRGGRSLQGIDAPGLIQLALAMCGIDAPREADLQRGLGEPVPGGAALKRHDLVFAENRCGLMIDDLLMIHASEEAGRVTVDPARLLGPELECRRLGR